MNEAQKMRKEKKKKLYENNENKNINHFKGYKTLEVSFVISILNSRCISIYKTWNEDDNHFSKLCAYLLHLHSVIDAQEIVKRIKLEK